MIDALSRDIDKGYDLYCSGGSRAQRLGAAFQLHVALNLLTAMVPREKLVPLFRLHEQLMELNRGVTSEMLKPEEWSRKPPIPTREAYERAHLAAAMHFKMEANRRAGGRGEKERAAREVGRRFNVGHRQVDDWREHAMRERPENDPIAWRYQQLLEAFPDDPNRAADRLMKAPLGAHAIG